MVHKSLLPLTHFHLENMLFRHLKNKVIYLKYVCHRLYCHLKWHLPLHEAMTYSGDYLTLFERKVSVVIHLDRTFGLKQLRLMCRHYCHLFRVSLERFLICTSKLLFPCLLTSHTDIILARHAIFPPQTQTNHSVLQNSGSALWTLRNFA